MSVSEFLPQKLPKRRNVIDAIIYEKINRRELENAA